MLYITTPGAKLTVCAPVVITSVSSPSTFIGSSSIVLALSFVLAVASVYNLTHAAASVSTLYSKYPGADNANVLSSPAPFPILPVVTENVCLIEEVAPSPAGPVTPIHCEEVPSA